jgi:hypothetical protein
MNTQQVLRQRAWTEAELKASRLKYYAPRKQCIMARTITLPVNVEMTIEILSADMGDVMVYDAGKGSKMPDVDQYDHWPVRRDLFNKTYKIWDDLRWQPNEAELHLIMHGCRPYYKHKGVWAIRLEKPVLIQSLESPKPVEVPPGRWLIIGSEGEPYHMADKKFRERYQVATRAK